MAVFDDIDFEGAKSVDPNVAPTGDKEDKTVLSGEAEIAPLEDKAVAPATIEEEVVDSPITSTGGLEVGTEIEVDGITYKVAVDGNIVDKDNKVFKEAKDVDSWIKSFDVKDADDADILSIETIQEALDVEVTDEDGKPIEFTNDKVGVKAYVDKVIELRTKEIHEAAINSLYEETPIVKNFIDYITVNNGDPRGFGEIRDRTSVEIDDTNVAQQEAIVRTAHSEFGRKGSVDSYIKYLKDTNALLDVSKEELAALQDKDKEEGDIRTANAESIRKQNIENTAKYWGDVKKNIDNRVIAGFKLPESLTVERDGKKLNVTPNDFFNYLNRTDSKTKTTGYQKDLNTMTDEEVMNADILDAWLHFTGGSYKDLVKMAINEEQVKKLVLASKNKKTTKTATITKPKDKFNMNDVILS